MIIVVTLSWNGLDKLKKLYPGLKANLETTGQEWQWLIRDNGSTDGTVAEASQWDNVKVLSINHNRDNFSQGINSLMNFAKQLKYEQISLAVKEMGLTPEMTITADTILLLNNDVEFLDKVSLFNMFELLKKPQIGIVGARLLYPNSNKLQHAGTIFGQRYGAMPYHFRHQEESDDQAKKNRYFQAVTAAVCMVRGSCWQSFDDKYFWAFEDVSFCLSLGSNGYKVAYCGQTEITHQESASLKKNPVNKLYLQHNVNYFKKQWLGKYPLDHDLYLTDPNYNVI